MPTSLRCPPLGSLTPAGAPPIDVETDQDLDIQITALRREGCTTIRSEKRSGTTTEGREELRTVLLSAGLNE
jgi:hypothetical protein